MSSANLRASLTNKLFKIAQKKYPVVLPPTNRSVLEHLLFACCLEDSPVEAADEVFAILQVEYFDMNEVRVTTNAELAETMKRLSNPLEAANRIRKALHGVFEAHYNFDIDFLRKENLGKAQEILKKYRGVSPFAIAYVTQHALGGHSIPIDNAMLQLLYTVGIISEGEMQQRKVPGLERTIPKNKGVDFAACVHPMAVEFFQKPHSKDIRDLLLSIAPDAAERFPKRGGGRKPNEKPEAETVAAITPEPETAAEPGKRGRKKKAIDPTVVESPAAPEKKSKKPAEKDVPKSNKISKIRPPAKRSAEKGKSNKPTAGRKPAGSAKSASSKLSKKKPR